MNTKNITDKAQRKKLKRAARKKAPLAASKSDQRGMRKIRRYLLSHFGYYHRL